MTKEVPKNSIPFLTINENASQSKAPMEDIPGMKAPTLEEGLAAFWKFRDQLFNLPEGTNRWRSAQRGNEIAKDQIAQDVNSGSE